MSLSKPASLTERQKKEVNTEIMQKKFTLLINSRYQ